MVKKKILVVDDEPNILNLVGMILEAEDYEVTKAECGSDCITSAEKQKPDLILLDIMMPEMDGWVVYRKLKENPETKDIPIAMLTVKAQAIDKEMALNVIGVEDYITKPFTPDELVQRVQRLVQ